MSENNAYTVFVEGLHNGVVKANSKYVNIIIRMFCMVMTGVKKTRTLHTQV